MFLFLMVLQNIPSIRRIRRWVIPGTQELLSRFSGREGSEVACFAYNLSFKIKIDIVIIITTLSLLLKFKHLSFKRCLIHPECNSWSLRESGESH